MTVKSSVTAAKDFLQFLNATGSPYHSVLAATQILERAGFQKLSDPAWTTLKKGGKYFVTRNHSTVLAFIIGKQFDPNHGGLLIAGSHTDSPCLRVRPSSDMTSESYRLLGVETYGGGLWHTWFDRPLGLAGKVVIRNTRSQIEERLLHIRRPLMVIPNLAIHLQSVEERGAFKINTESHLRPILCSNVMNDVASTEEKNLTSTEPGEEKEHPVGKEQPEGKSRLEPVKMVLANELGCKPEDILDMDLSLMDVTEGQLVGPYDEFIHGARLDNQVSVWASMTALSEMEPSWIEQSKDICIAIAWDNEEVGSVSFAGADSVTFERWIQQILQGVVGSAPDAKMIQQVISKGILFSVDGAHAVHPNYAEKHQAQHKPLLHRGVVVKKNSSMRYASHATTMALVRTLAKATTPEIPLQFVVVRNDSPCGTTIGPMTTALLGIRGIDLGVGQWAMHSIRETCGTSDVLHLKNLITGLYTYFREIDDEMVVL